MNRNNIVKRIIKLEKNRGKVNRDIRVYVYALITISCSAVFLGFLSSSLNISFVNNLVLSVITITLDFISIILYANKEDLFIQIYKFRLRLSDPNRTASKVNQKNKNLSPYYLFCAAILQKPEDRDYALGCFEERFKKDCEKLGCHKAKFLFWRDLIMSIYPLVSSKVMKIAKMAGLSYVIERFLFK